MYPFFLYLLTLEDEDSPFFRNVDNRLPRDAMSYIRSVSRDRWENPKNRMISGRQKAELLAESIWLGGEVSGGLLLRSFAQTGALLPLR